jgi:putative SOS response-associated peptidase YedK
MTEPNDLLRPIHDRMPVIVKKELEDFWIDPSSHNSQNLFSILKPYPAVDMEASEAIMLKN